ncbi:MAG: L,D-transpeptidase family protein [Verrucomicrobiota bacterium]|nr:L,D-transpeptidase family protein [Verrucomicrobiota bacterium]
MNFNLLFRVTSALLVCFVTPFALAQTPRPTVARPPFSGRTVPGPLPARASAVRPGDPRPPQAPAGTPLPNQPMRKASELISRQAPINVNQSVYDDLKPDAARIVVSLTKQRAYLLSGDQVAIDTPISSGKRAGMTPSGRFSVLEKDKDHRSSVYGDFVDREGRVVRSGVSVRIDSAPSGTHYVGAPMTWFMRLTDDGVGMHIGILPGYPASHGCIRMPSQAAAMFYAKVRVGTPAEVKP